MAHTLDELPLYSKVLELGYGEHERGFEQPTDAAFANFVFTAKGSTAEVIARMKEAHRKQHITDEQLAGITALGEPLGKMMGGFIKYLAASGFTDRGRHAVAPTPRKPHQSPRRR